MGGPARRPRSADPPDRRSRACDPRRSSTQPSADDILDTGRFRRLDLGLDARGRIVAVYRSCSLRRCGGVFVADVRSGGERRLVFHAPARCRSFGPVARWRTAIAATLACRGGARSGVYVIRGRHARLVRRLSARARTGVTLDLGPDVLVAASADEVWVASPGQPACRTVGGSGPPQRQSRRRARDARTRVVGVLDRGGLRRQRLPIRRRVAVATGVDTVPAGWTATGIVRRRRPTSRGGTPAVSSPRVEWPDYPLSTRRRRQNIVYLLVSPRRTTPAAGRTPSQPVIEAVAPPGAATSAAARDDDRR